MRAINKKGFDTKHLQNGQFQRFCSQRL